MRVIRGQLRKHGAKEMSVPHFRTLSYLNRHEGTSLSEVAEHIGPLIVFNVGTNNETCDSWFSYSPN